MLDLVGTDAPTPHRLGGPPRGVFKRTWPQCAGCGKWTTPLFTLEATAELPLGDAAGLVAMVCETGCANPDTKSRVSNVKLIAAKDWKRPLKAPPSGVQCLPERYAILRQVTDAKIAHGTCARVDCTKAYAPVLAYRYRRGQCGVIAMCSERHDAEWLDVPPLTKGFDAILAWRAQFK